MVNEEQTGEKETTENPNANDDSRNEPTATELIERTNAATKGLKDATERAERAARELAELEARKQLGGETSGNAKSSDKPEEVNPVDYAKAAIEGKLPKKE